MHDILLSGYYGYGNGGDEAILQASVLAFQKEQLNVAVLSNVPQKTSENLHVAAYPRHGIRALIKAVKNSRLVLSGGGGLFQDATSLRSLLYYLRVPFLGKLFRKKTMVFAQGIGPIETFAGKRLVQWICNHFMDEITVRDQPSKELLLSLGVKKMIHVTSDLAFLFPSPSTKDKERIVQRFHLPRQGGLAGIVLRDWPQIRSCLPQMGQAFSGFCSTHQLTPVLVSFQPGKDHAVINALEAQLTCPSIKVVDPLSPSELFSLLSMFELTIAMRFHALLFSARSYVPCLGIAYDAKVASLAQSLGCPWLTLRELSSGSFLEKLMAFRQNKGAIQKLLQSNIPLLSKKAQDNIDQALRLLAAN